MNSVGKQQETVVLATIYPAGLNDTDVACCIALFKVSLAWQQFDPAVWLKILTLQVFDLSSYGYN